VRCVHRLTLIGEMQVPSLAETYPLANGGSHPEETGRDSSKVGRAMLEA
jgi:hypothetical protein